MTKFSCCLLTILLVLASCEGNQDTPLPKPKPEPENPGNPDIEEPITLEDNYDPALYGENATTIFYVSGSGIDAQDRGTQEKPWKTLAYAAARATKGSTIRLASGSYTIDATVNIPVGVSLEGAGASGASATTITASGETLHTEWNAIINLISSDNTDGNQHISNIFFNGENFAVQALEIRNRNNVAVHHCIFKDFQYVGIGWRTTDFVQIPPSYCPAGGNIDDYQIARTFVTGGRFYNNTTTNCTGRTDWGRGALLCGGLNGFRIYNNHMTEQHTQGNMRGVPIKFWYFFGWMLDCKIYNNTIAMLGTDIYGYSPNGETFAIESRFSYGMEICNNDIIGNVDLNDSFTGPYRGFLGYIPTGSTIDKTYSFGAWIHDNYMHAEGDDGWMGTAIYLEFFAEGVLVENNTVTDCACALFFTPRTGHVHNVTLKNNICTDMRDGYAVRGQTNTDETFDVQNLSIKNNAFLCSNCGTEGTRTGEFGIKFIHEGRFTGTDISITDNIFAGFMYNPLYIDNYKYINGLDILNNKFYNNNGWNGVNSDSITGYVANPETLTDYNNNGNIILTDAAWTELYHSIIE